MKLERIHTKSIVILMKKGKSPPDEEISGGTRSGVDARSSWDARTDLLAQGALADSASSRAELPVDPAAGLVLDAATCLQSFPASPIGHCRISHEHRPSAIANQRPPVHLMAGPTGTCVQHLS
jgi:hypothetical protein